MIGFTKRMGLRRDPHTSRVDAQAWDGMARYFDELAQYTPQVRRDCDVQRFMIGLARDGVEAPVEKEVEAMFA